MKLIIFTILFFHSAFGTVPALERHSYLFANSKYVVFIAHGTKCPIVAKYYPKIKNLSKEFSSKKIVFLFVNSTLYADRGLITKELKKYAVDLPIIFDQEQDVARELGLNTTSQAVIYNTHEKKVEYSGAIDDSINFDIQHHSTKNSYLKDQLTLLVNSKTPTIRTTEVYGCSITFKKN